MVLVLVVELSFAVDDEVELVFVATVPPATAVPVGHQRGDAEANCTGRWRKAELNLRGVSRYAKGAVVSDARLCTPGVCTWRDGSALDANKEPEPFASAAYHERICMASPPRDRRGE